MNEAINKLFLTGTKFMSELHLKNLRFTYCACGRFTYCTKHCERIQRFKETGNLKHLYRYELDKACFVHDLAYSDSKDLANRSISDNVFKEKI